MDASGLNLLIALKSKGLLKPGVAVAEMGAQELFCRDTPDILSAFIEAFDGSPAPSDELETLSCNGPAGRLYALAGFSRYVCFDTSGEFDAVSLDLNLGSVPAEHVKQYDLVTNFGTTEHVADQENVFSIIHDLCRPKGIMVHRVPAQGWIEHGLINYNPKFFWRLTENNDYRLIHMDFIISPEEKPIPPAFASTIRTIDSAYRMHDVLLEVVLQRTTDNAYVPPFDGLIVDEAVRRRYWANRDKRHTS